MMNNFDSDNTRFVITHTLQILGDYSRAAENLLLITAALEAEHTDASQQGGLGLYRISWASHLRIWDNYLAFDPDLASTIRGLASQKAFLQAPHLELATNLAYASAIAWMIYQSSDLTLPAANDTQKQTACWAKYFAKQAMTLPCPRISKWNRLTESQVLQP